jgi:hypothetical protein
LIVFERRALKRQCNYHADVRAVAQATVANARKFRSVPGPRPPKPPFPPSIVRLMVNGDAVSGCGFGRHPSEGPVPQLRLTIGQLVSFAVSIEAPTDIYVGHVWLVVNSYPSGFAWGTPTGKFALLAHEPGPLTSTQQVRATWTPETLFDRNKLDLTISFAVGNQSTAGQIAHLDLTQRKCG